MLKPKINPGLSGKLTKFIFTFLFFIFLSANLFAQVTQEWVQRYNGPVNQDDTPVSGVVDDYGNVYVTGNSYGIGTGKDCVTIKYNTNGVQQWIQRYNGPGNSDDHGSSIAVDDSGNVYVTGESNGSGTGYDYATIKYNSSGVQQWVQRYAGTGSSYDVACDLKLDDSGNVYITGECNYDIVTIKYNNAGVVQWVNTYNGPANLGDRGKRMTLDDDGNVYVAGDTGFNPLGVYSNYVTLKYNSAGVQQWVAIYDGPYRDDGTDAVAVDSSGNVYVSGFSSSPSNQRICITIKYNSAGVQQWLQSYNGSSYDIGLDKSGNVYLTGWYWQNYRDYATVKYSTTGIQLWNKAYNGPGNGDDVAVSLAVDDTGNVYVAGRSTGSGTNFDFTTIKYDSSGVQKWMKSYNGLGNSVDVINSISIDDSGNVYVTGPSIGSGTGFDYATIKYTQAPLPIPSVPLLVSPANGATLVELNPLLDWDNSLYAESYHIQVSTDSLFASIVYGSIGIPFSEFQIPNNGLNINTTYFWRVNATNVTGTSPWSIIFHFTTGTTNITLNNEIPKEFKLYNSYPNPFNPSTKIKFDIPKSSYVKLIVYDVLGREIKTLVNEKLNAGRYETNWDGSDYPSGVYFYRLVTMPDGRQADDYVSVKKMILIK